MVEALAEPITESYTGCRQAYKRFLREVQPLKPAGLPNYLDEDWPALLSHFLQHGDKGSIYETYAGTELLSAKKYRSLLSPDVKEFLSTRQFENKKPKFSFIDLFAGVGGFRLSLNKQGGRSVFSSEWDNSAKETYFNNYKEIPFGDITKFTNDTIGDELLNHLIPDHDILCAGFPCQPFSRAGVSARNALNLKHGFECKTQGTLFYDVVRIASIKRPKVLFLENVRNLKSHDEGNTFRVIQESIEELGYSFTHELINAQTMVPQKRVRCYMVCVRQDIPSFTFNLEPFAGDPIPLSTILERGKKIEEYQISEKLWSGHINRTKRNIERGTGFTALETDVNKPANTLVARYGKDGKECLIPTRKGTSKEAYSSRSLTSARVPG